MSFVVIGATSCGLLPNVKVWLKRADFEVAPGANRGAPFACHIVVAYSNDLYERLKGMDAQGYFTGAVLLERTYKDSIEVFKFDMIPGRNQIDKELRLRSYTKAKGAFVFAKYASPGKFMENVGSSPNIVVKFLPYKMEVISALSLEALLDRAEGKLNN